MKSNFCLEMAMLVAFLAGGLSGCSSQPDKTQKMDPKEPQPLQEADLAASTIRIDGSSTVAPVSILAAEEFRKKYKEVRVPITTSGTGGGFKKFVKGETDISNASRPILKAEIEEAAKNRIEFIELAICFDAITVVVNKNNDWATDLTVEELKTIWSKASEGKITKWNEIRAGWPEEKFELFGPGSDSGTFDYFTEAICGKAGDSRKDYVASEDDHRLVRGVADNKFALGYFGFAYYAAYKDKLTAVKVKGAKAKEAVEPWSESIRDGAYTPLSRPLFIYVNKASSARPEVDRFVLFFLDNAVSLASRKKYVPLPTEAYALVRKHYEERRIGSVFGGIPEVGLSIDALLHRERK